MRHVVRSDSAEGKSLGGKKYRRLPLLGANLASPMEMDFLDALAHFSIRQPDRQRSPRAKRLLARLFHPRISFCHLFRPTGSPRRIGFKFASPLLSSSKRSARSKALPGAAWSCVNNSSCASKAPVARGRSEVVGRSSTCIAVQRGQAQFL